MNNQNFDILLTGVGGQGTVLASRLLAEAAMAEGLFVRTSETIGMAQRGGSVTSHLRIASRDKSPLITYGTADLLIGFEPSEALRNLHTLKPGGKILVNTKEIRPVTASLNPDAYHIEDILEALQATPNAVLVDAYALALQAGNIKALNTVLLGAAFAENMLPFTAEQFQRVMQAVIPAKLYEINQKAFELGLRWRSFNNETLSKHQ